MLLQFRKEYFFNLLALFIIIQPILDILTSISIRYFDFSITIGIVIRVLFMLISLVFIFFGNKQPLKKYLIIYLIALFTIVGIGFIFNYFSKPNFFIFEELQFLAKTIYFSVMFCAVLLAFQLNSNTVAVKNKLLSLITISMSVVSVSFFIAIFTNTSSATYNYDKAGYVGWFYAGNEISAIVAICFPLVLLHTLKNTKSFRDIFHWAPPLLLAITAMLIGTKVSFLAVFMTLIISLVINLVHWIICLRRNGVKNNHSKGLLITIMLFIFFICTVPFSPAYDNFLGDYSNISEQTNDTDEESQQSEDDQSTEIGESDTENNITQGKSNFLLDSGILKSLLSSRNVYFENIYLDYVDSDIFHKLFGLGYAGFYEEQPKLIEMDFFDLFFSFGIIGNTLILLPLFVTFFFVLKLLFTKINTFFSSENILLLTSAGLGLGIAMLAGHVLFAPAVCFYLAISLVFLLSYSTSYPEKPDES